MWITNAPVADVAVIWARTDDGIARLRRTDGHARRVGARDHPQDVAARLARPARSCSTTSALPAAAQLPDARGLKAPLSCLTEARFGIVWGALGAARDCLDTAIDYATTREQFGRPIAGFQLTQAKLADMALELQKGYLLALHLGRLADAGRSYAGAGQRRQAQQRPRGDRDRPAVPDDPRRERHQRRVPGAAARRTTWRACSPTRARPRCTSS